VTGYFYGVGNTLENATKAYLLYFTLAIGKEFRDEKITKMIDVICLCPGPI
jgi:short-subunit dehydrogenase